MNTAPERICAAHGLCWNTPNEGHPASTEYVRADLYTALQADNARLREALQRIVAMDQDYMKCRRYTDEIARAALSGGDDND